MLIFLFSISIIFGSLSLCLVDFSHIFNFFILFFFFFTFLSLFFLGWFFDRVFIHVVGSDFTLQTFV